MYIACNVIYSWFLYIKYYLYIVSKSNFQLISNTDTDALQRSVRPKI